MPRSHLSPLALEAVLLGQAPADAARHAAGCDACRAHLETMERAGGRFSASTASLGASRAFAHADRRWKQVAGLASLAPLAAALAVVAVVQRSEPPPAPVVAAHVPRSVPRQARDVLEPRGGAPAPRPRQLTVRGRPLEFGQGTLEGAATADGPTLPFTLVHTKVDAAVSGLVSEVTVTQTFRNPFAQPVEALYVFPLPDDAAVHSMSLVAGGRVIRATVQKRAEARRQYETAKAEGRRAALLDQERPNVFTQSVANLLPGETVEVRLAYVAPLHFDDGTFGFVFPMVVGPRFIPGATLPGESEGSGTARDTDQVPDASRVTPPVSRSGRDVEVSLRLEAGALIEDLWSVSHRLQVDRPGARQATLSLDAQDTVPNKDLIVRWRVSGAGPRAGVVAEGGAFALLLAPEPAGAHAPVSPKELVFLIDTSCSMNGPPLAAAKRAMGQALRRASDGDTFMLIDFAERARVFHPTPLRATGANVARALAYLDALPAGGSTNQLAGLRKAFARPEDPERVRLVLLLTDGFIGNEDEVLATARTLRGNARVFGLGVGSSVNHFLLSRLSEEGRGFYQFIRPDEDASGAVERFVRRTARPLVTDVTIDWGGLPVADVTPEAVPDLFDAQPLAVYGRYRGAAEGTVVVRGRRAGVPVRYEVPVKLPEAHLGGRALATTWARQQVERLSAQARRGESAELVAAITALGLEHHLVTKYTSLVAVEEHAVTGVAARTVVEPSLPVEQVAQAGKLGAMLGSSFGDVLGTGGLGLSGVGAGGSGLGLRGTGAGGGGAGSGALGGTQAAALGSGAGLGGPGRGAGWGGSGLAALGGPRAGGAATSGSRGGLGGDRAGVASGGGRAGALGGRPPGATASEDARAATPGFVVSGLIGKPDVPAPSSGTAARGSVTVGDLGTAGGRGSTAPPADPAAFADRSRLARPAATPPTASTRAPGGGATPRANELVATVVEDPTPASEPGPATRAPVPAGVTVRGAISRDAVLRVVRAHVGEVQRCVERQQRLTPGLNGVLRTTWRVRADGSVLDVRVLSAEHEHLPLGRCVATVISRWRFPAMGAEWAVTFPFHLGTTP